MGFLLAAYGLTAAVLIGYALWLRARRAALIAENRSHRGGESA